MSSVSGKTDIDWRAFADALAPVETITETVLIKKRSRDFFRYSPILNAASHATCPMSAISATTAQRCKCPGQTAPPPINKSAARCPRIRTPSPHCAPGWGPVCGCTMNSRGWGVGIVTFDLPIIWFSTAERLAQINATQKASGFPVYVAHV